ncbi:MAG: 18 kDa heat shock protein [Acidimicrobiales bacterium]|nr:MAG: Hsp20/alpha crystallin family protein [Actinomycetota bacterium]MBV6508933.1 18 kDa heat shock protein [Acidimicrobiales bacterium]RIK08429.1 MAG: hypothetical protein DCC48_00310 [Acidobacteriota bacterium]
MFSRFDPFRELERSAGRAWAPYGRPAVPLDAVRRGDEVIMAFDLPGNDHDQIDVTVEKNVLTLTANRPSFFADDDEVLARERRRGEVKRQIVLSDELDGDAARAEYADGVLVVRVPLAERAKPHRVAIVVGEPSAEDAGASSN